MNVLEIHRCRFIEWKPSTIIALAFQPIEKTNESNESNWKKQYLALVRANSDIEIWKCEFNMNKLKQGIEWKDCQIWYMEKRIVGYNEMHISSLIWYNSKYFVCGTLTSKIIQWDFHSLKDKKILSSYGGAIWCLSINNKINDHEKQMIAAGCEDGCIRLYSISKEEDGDDELEYVKSFIKQKGRILCLAWHSNNEDIFAGTNKGYIKRFNVLTGQITLVIHPPKRRTSIIWSISVLKDFTVISGSSLGITSFWDGNLGTLIKEFHQHEADVLCITVNNQENSVFSAGVDNKISMFQMVFSKSTNSNDNGIWVHVQDLRIHTHDIKALTYSSELDIIASGGVDTQLCINSVTSFVNNRGSILIRPFPQQSIVYLSRSKRCFLVQLQDKLQLWNVGKRMDENSPLPSTNTFLTIGSPCKQILELQLKSSSNLVCSALSSNANFIACADSKKIKLFKLHWDNEIFSVTIEKLQIPLEIQNITAQCLFFTLDELELFLSHSFMVYVINLKDMKLDYTLNCLYQNKDEEINDSSLIYNLTVSDNKKWLAIGNFQNKIQIFNLETKQYYFTLPYFEFMHTTFSFLPKSSTLAVAYSSNHIILYDIDKKKIHSWSKKYQNQLPQKLFDMKTKIIGIKFHPNKDSLMLLFGYNFICFIDLEKKQKEDIFKFIEKYTNNIYVDFLLNDKNTSLLIVQIPWSQVMESFPPPLFREKFGT